MVVRQFCSPRKCSKTKRIILMKELRGNNKISVHKMTTDARKSFCCFLIHVPVLYHIFFIRSHSTYKEQNIFDNTVKAINVNMICFLFTKSIFMKQT